MPINTIMAIVAVSGLVVFAAYLTWEINRGDKEYKEDWWYEAVEKQERQGPSEPQIAVIKLKGNFIGEYNDYNQ